MAEWECQICLTQNDHLETKTQEPRVDCEACETERPGYTKTKSILKKPNDAAIQGSAANILFGGKSSGTGGSAVAVDGPKFGKTGSTSTSGISSLFGKESSEKESSGKESSILFGAKPVVVNEEIISGISALFEAKKEVASTESEGKREAAGGLFGGRTTSCESVVDTQLSFGSKTAITPATPPRKDDIKGSGQGITPTRSMDDGELGELSELGYETGSTKLSQRIKSEIDSVDQDVSSLLRRCDDFMDIFKGMQNDGSMLGDDSLKSGKIMIWGSGECDQMPFRDNILDDNDGVMKPTGIDRLNKYELCQARCGALHSVVLIDDGRVATFGCNDNKALGREITQSGKERFPGIVKFEGGEPVERCIAVDAGNSHTLLLRDDGKVIVMGGYKASSSASAAYRDNRHPTIVELPSKAIAIGSGSEHSLAICKKNKDIVDVYVWGVNEYGTFGRSSIENPSTEQLKESVEPSKIEPPAGTHILWAYAGGNATVLKVRNGNDIKFLACGCNGAGEVGVGSTEVIIDTLTEITELRNKDVKNIVLSDSSGKALMEDGSLYSWGHPDSLGMEGMKGSRDPIRAPIKVNRLPRLRSIWAGGNTSFAATADDPRVLLGWGDSLTGQLGDELDDVVRKPITIGPLEGKAIVSVGVGSQHCCALFVEEENLPVKVPERTRKRSRANNAVRKGAKKPYLSSDEAESRKYPNRARKTVPKFTF